MRKKIKQIDTIEEYTAHVKGEMKRLMDYTHFDPDDQDYNKAVRTMVKAWIAGRNRTGALSTNDKTKRTRMIDAFCNTISMLHRRFSEKFPNLPIEYAAVHSQYLSIVATPDELFVSDGGYTTRYINLGAALYILDSLKDNGTLQEALLYMPYKKSELDKIDLPSSAFSDCAFSNDIIQSMVYLIENRDGHPESAFMNLTNAKVTPETAPVIEFATERTTNDELAQNRDKILTAASQMTYRERFNKIISLMPEDIVKQAEQYFKDKIMELQELVFQIMEPSWKNIFEASEKIASADKLIERMQKNRTRLRKATENPIPLLPKNCSAKDPVDTIKDIANDISKIMESVQKDEQELTELLRNANNTRINMLNRMESQIGNIYLGCCNDFKYSDFPELKPIGELKIEDPYELIFGCIALLDKGDDIVWLANMTTCLISIASSRLPWIFYQSEPIRNMAKELKNKPDELRKINSNDTKTLHYLPGNDTPEFRNKSAVMYDRTYTDYIKWQMFGISEPDEKDLGKINFPQLTFSLNDKVLPRRFRNYCNELTDIIVKSGVNKQNAAIVRLIAEIAESETNKISYALPKEDDVDKDTIIKNLQKQLNESTKTISELRSSLRTAEKKANDEQKKLEQKTEETAGEHEELIQLRQMMYELQKYIDDNRETTFDEKTEISFPYTSDKNIVIFGGHPSWLRTMRQLLPEVRFIEPQENPDVNAIRNADVIWMQVNAMPHCFYGKIMDIARQRKLPVKYFTHASAEKCARELAEDDASAKIDDMIKI